MKTTLLPILASSGVFLYFSLMFAIPSGYSYGAMTLLLSGVYFMVRHPFPTLTGEDKAIIFSLLAVFLWSVLAVWLHNDSPKPLDQTSRLIMAIPIMLMLLAMPPRLPLLWASVVIGVVLSNGIAAWQLHWLGDDRASGFLNIIHFGNIGLVFGLFCIAGMLWAGTQGRYATHWRVAFLIGVLASIYTVMASGSRGSWLAIPPVLLVFLYAFMHRRNIKHAAMGLAGLVIAVGVVFSIPETGVQERYDLAVTEVDKYMATKYVGKDAAVSSVGARLEVWRTAFILIPQRPLLGWSHKDSRAELERLVAEKKVDPYMLEMANTHNNYLEVLLFQGVIGLGLLLAMYLLPFWYFCKRLRSPDLPVKALALCGSSLLASYFMFGMSQVILGRNNGIIFFVLTMVIVWACMRNAES
ncbi:O-antigen ligase family protein [Pollutimonas nitritireducens]|uniref:O-antigen ligase family protein n=1 Tax=Pollutimonas nitritireducens TaxID=2045209 RepID=UPI0013040F66|nr:O-antigen ligase family protein [Pollutimonas nitritireducens]